MPNSTEQEISDSKSNLIKSGKNMSHSSLRSQQNKDKLMLFELDPKRCKPWEYHNRDVAWLTKERCQDLIGSIQQSGQIDPVLVRKIENDPNYDLSNMVFSI